LTSPEKVIADPEKVKANPERLIEKEIVTA